MIANEIERQKITSPKTNRIILNVNNKKEKKKKDENEQ